MEITVVRRWYRPSYIIGELYINGSRLCNTLEPTLDRPNFPAIRPGSFVVDVHRSSKFGALRPYLLEVPGRTGIMIHEGNSVADTLGCILVGDNELVGKVTSSRKRLTQLLDVLAVARRAGERITCTVISL